MEQKMKSARKIKWKSVLLVIFIILELIYIFRYELMGIANTVLFAEYTLEELTEEEKVADFETFYSSMLESAPYLEEVKDLYGVDFVARKDYYLSEIKATESNVEYYGVMAAISKDLASFHTDICFPMYSNLQGLNCYNYENVLSQFGMEAKVNAWYEEIGEAAQKYEEVSLFCVRYVDGAYILKEGWLSDSYKEMANYELISVDGISADEYIVDNLSIYGLGYDFLLDKAYRENYTFNDSVGDAVEVVWKSVDGTEIAQTLYVDKGVEVAASYGYLFSDRYEYYGESSGSNFVMERDDANQLEYIQVNNFDNNDGATLQKYLANTTYDKVVIDLRNNYGGQIDYAKKYIYPELYTEHAEFSYSWKVPNTEQNEKMTGKLSTRFLYYEDKDKDFFYYSNSLGFAGKASADKEVYYLIGPDTGSAADTYIAAVKANGLGTVVGSNTGGEGLGASFICDSLENSSLVYIYYPSVPTEGYEDENPLGGTAPDVYINQSVEDYALQEQMRIEGTDASYEARLQYDTVLKWVIGQE